MSRGHARPDQARLDWRIGLLLGCYPPWWRVRYDDEMRDTVLALRDEGRWGASGTRDLLRGLVEAWFVPNRVPSEQSNADPTRTLIPGAAWGLLLFVLAGSAFAKVVEDPAFSEVARQHAALGWCVTVLRLAGIAAAVAMVLAAVPTVAAILRHRSANRRRDLGLLLVPPMCGVVWLLTLAITSTAATGNDAHQTSRVVAFIALVAVTILGGVVTTIALMRVAMSPPTAAAVATSRRLAMVAVGALTVLAAAAVVVWTFVAAFESPALLRSDNGLLESPTLLTTAVVIAGLLAAAALCLRSALEALSSSSG